MKIVNVYDFEGLYCVTDEGRVFSLNTGREMVASVGAKGYLQVHLRKSGKSYCKRLNRVVWGSFNGGCDDNLVIDHIDGNVENNNLSNLQQITSRENTTKCRRPVSGYHGVVWYPANKKWEAALWINRKRIHLGMFEDPVAAHLAYVNAKKRWHEEHELPERRTAPGSRNKDH